MSQRIIGTKIKISIKNKYQKNVASSYSYKLMCVDNKFNKPFKSYLGGDAVYNFINSMVKKVNIQGVI